MISYKNVINNCYRLYIFIFFIHVYYSPHFTYRMARKYLTCDEMVEVIVKINQNVSIKEVARQYGVNESTIRRRYKTYLETKRLGRKAYSRARLISEDDLERLETYILENRFNTVQEIKIDLTETGCHKIIIVV